MSRPESAETEAITDSLIGELCARLAAGKRVRRSLPGEGRLHIDRPLPFLCVYRRPTDRPDAGTDRLVLGEGSYLIAGGGERLQESQSALAEAIVKTLADQFGAFLIVEIWSAAETGALSPNTRHPTFRILTPRRESLATTVQALADALRSLALPGTLIEVEVVDGGKAAPPGLPSLLTTTEASKLGCLMIGLEVTPFYRDAETGDLYPLLLRALHREFSRALQKTFFDFVQVQTTHRPQNYQMLGRRAVVRAVWEADRQLAHIDQSFNLLLAVSPVNADAAYAEFEQSGFERAPAFHYRMLPVDPDALKRRLYNTPLERVEDPTIALLLRDKRIELDRQINLLEDRDTSRFLYSSLQLYGGVDDDLLRLSESLLARLPAGGDGEPAEERLGATAFAECARAEIEYYRQLYPALSAAVEIREDIPGLMVARGNLLVGLRTRVARRRVEAALQHEVGTHIVTYFNGRAQPLRQLCTGLPGYDELQEGLAVMAEYLVGGLSPSRLRLLAARVIAVDLLVRGASFVELFRELRHDHGFGRQTAFTITMRVYRGGGFTKDAVYLRGLRNLLNYLKEGGAIEPLFVGKINFPHVPLIQELQWRQTLRPAPLFPRYLSSAQSRERLERLRNGLSVLDLIERG
jgi:uncharacterized protein (TIGR02421 family)